MIFEFADALNLAVLNTRFKQKESRLFTYELGKCRTVVDYIYILSRSERKWADMVKVECINQHRLHIFVYDLQERVG